VETILRGASRVEGALFSAFPNAGMPLMSQGRMIYEAGPDYFASRSVEFLRLGVRLIGGCCGTTPRHIKALRAALDREGIKPAAARPKAAPLLSPPPRGEVEGGFLSSLRPGRLPIVVEIDPPFSPEMDRVVQGALAVKNAGADAVTMADNPLATLRVNSICAAAAVRQRARIQVISHLTARDHNVLGLQSLLMGADVLGIEGILAVTGDPAGKGDQPGTQGVYSVNSVHLVGLIDQLNRGHMLSGKAINRPTNFSIGVAFNANVPRLSVEVDRLRRKVAGGARFVFTQPVFSEEKALRVLEACSGIEARVFIGILPLVSSRNAEFLHNEVPGITIPAPLRARLASLRNGEEQRRAGLDFAREMIAGIKDAVEGLYIISPLNRWSLARDLVKMLREG
jgi:homocysteine S-methyltransferase